MGVWAANRVLTADTQSIRIQRTLAIGGTPYGIHSQFGIPHDWFASTIQVCENGQWVKLYRRMLSSPHWRHDDITSWLPASESFERLNDLIALFDQARQDVAHIFPWQQAWIAQHDHIFPHTAQLRAWHQLSVPIVRYNGAHHALRHFDSWAAVFDAFDAGIIELHTKDSLKRLVN